MCDKKAKDSDIDLAELNSLNESMAYFSMEAVKSKDFDISLMTGNSNNNDGSDEE